MNNLETPAERVPPPEAASRPPERVKLGLALSGGGFRASFFHLGVLARLAELGILRKVEVLSTVSGGSIIGALYYLRAQRLLQQPGEQPQDSDYVTELKWIAGHLRSAVRRNPRARIFLNLFKNLRMAVPSVYVKLGSKEIGWAHYSRTDRIGDLLDKYLYKHAWEQKRPKRRVFLDEQISMQELLILPPGRTSFDPGEENPGRDAKVPILLLNATSLNTGHNWRFEAIRMGEPVPDDKETARIVEDVQKNERLAQGYFKGSSKPPQKPITSRQREFPLGLAVAASATVPGAFHPLSITGLYTGIKVQLVDGGVHDNQGVQGLFDTDCSHLIVSDASGQMRDKPKPGTRIPAVVSRTTSVYGTRVRQEQLVRARKDTTRPIALMHLRKGLAPGVLEPLADDGSLVMAAPQSQPQTSAFGVDADVQKLLAEIRTDLDAFSDTEAKSLMLDGYLMADFELATNPDFAIFRSKEPIPPNLAEWELTSVADLIGPTTAKPKWYSRSLEVGRHLLFKGILGLPKWLLRGLGVAGAAGAVAMIVIWRHEIGDGVSSLWSDSWPAGWTLVAVGGAVVLAVLYLIPIPWVSQILLAACVTVPLAPVLVILSLLMLLETPFYLCRGRLR